MTFQTGCANLFAPSITWGLLQWCKNACYAWLCRVYGFSCNWLFTKTHIAL